MSLPMPAASTYLLGLAALVALAPLLMGLSMAVRAYLRYRGSRVVVCPERLDIAAVEVDAAVAALTAPYGRPDLRLKSCSHWREPGECGEKCLAQIAAAPEACLLRNILSGWYLGRICVYCHRPFAKLRWHDHAPALLSPARVTVEWKDVPPERVMEVLATHRPVCWNCHVAETFRHAHPDLVTERPPRGHTRA